MKDYIILLVAKPPNINAFDMVWESWKKAVALQMILEFEIPNTHMTYRIIPDMRVEEVEKIAEEAYELELMYLSNLLKRE